MDTVEQGNLSQFIPTTLSNGQPIPGSCNLSSLGQSVAQPQMYIFLSYMSTLGSNHPQLNSEYQHHGIFISALLHHLAPQAHIYMIQVLNTYGVGDMQSLLWGLSRVIKPEAIVNISLTVVTSPGCVESIWNDLPSWQALPPDQLSSQFAECNSSPNTVYQRYAPFGEAIHDVVTNKTLHLTLVAAAGNDSTASKHLPAAYCGVISVAATDASGVYTLSARSNCVPLAMFSNTPDISESCLCDTSQQGTDHLHEVVTDGQSICSLFPGNPDYLALWLGTSFATAIVSGNLATGSLVANGPSISLAPGGQRYSDKQPCSTP